MVTTKQRATSENHSTMSFLAMFGSEALGPAYAKPLSVKFNAEVSKVEKRNAGHTDVQNTPLEVHSRIELKHGFKDHVREQIEHALRHNATRVERVEVWFDDLNGPKGGVDTRCRVTLHMGGQPNIFVEEVAASAGEALDLLIPRLGRVLDNASKRKGRGARKSGGRPKAQSIALADAAALSEATTPPDV